MADKSLGQHWLFDKPSLAAICDAADVKSGDNVLEVGPGLGTLTHELLSRGAKVIAVELDKKLADDLQNKFEGKDFTLHLESITSFDLTGLPPNYKVVANIPYYLTSHLLRLLSESSSRPSKAVLLVQKEVAERVAAIPGHMSLLSVSVQVYAAVSLGKLVQAELFSPPPKVDSQVLVLDFFDKPAVGDPKNFFKMVKAGFSSPRKKLRSSLGAGLSMKPSETDKLLLAADIDPDRRAQTLSIAEWRRLSEQYSATPLPLNT